MRKIVFVFITFIFISCDTHKNDKVVFIRLFPWLSWDSLGVPQIVVRQYTEFSLLTQDSLVITKSEKPYDVSQNLKIPMYGLENFYHYKVNDKFVKSMTKLLNSNYKKTYRRTFSEPTLDDRYMDFIIIIRDKHFQIIPYEHDYLPEELKQIDDSVNKYVKSIDFKQFKVNYSYETISRLQDSLFKRVSPPRRLKSTVKFIPPVLKDEKEKQTK